jgi:periplasmic divalent cation tolerance protein
LPDAAIVVLTHVPDRNCAETLAQSLLAGKLAACVNIGAPVTSMYHWRGQIETAEEIPLVVKTRAGLFEAVATAIRAGHPHELPEIVAVSFSDGYSPYLEWIHAETARP